MLVNYRQEYPRFNHYNTTHYHKRNLGTTSLMTLAMLRRRHRSLVIVVAELVWPALMKGYQIWLWLGFGSGRSQQVPR